jgi:hypothetical protein
MLCYQNLTLRLLMKQNDYYCHLLIDEETKLIAVKLGLEPKTLLLLIWYSNLKAC